jgi:thiol-disulfide isomerase/thioredoxin
MAEWRRRLAMAAVAVAALGSGCSPPPEENQTLEAPQPAAGDEAAVPSVPIAVVDRAGLDNRIAEHKGKVVLVDFWATWCAPCMEQLPHTLALARDHGDQGLAVATVCMEDPEEKERIAKALAARGANADTPADHFLSREGGAAAAMEAFEIPGGALPCYRVYDKAGKLRHEFALDPAAEKQFTSDDIAAAVNSLLAE